MESKKKTADLKKNQEDFLDALAAVTLVVLSVLLVIFMLHDRPY